MHFQLFTICITLVSTNKIETTLHTNCTQTAHKLHTNCTQTAHKLHTNCTQTAHKLHTNCTQTAHKTYFNLLYFTLLGTLSSVCTISFSATNSANRRVTAYLSFS